MVTVEKALQIIDARCPVLKSEKLPLGKTLNRILAGDVISPIHMPPFRQSAMDGYALNFSGAATSYKLVGEIAAGSAEIIEPKSGEAVRIFTGGAVPDTATHVVQQEIVTRYGNEISFTAEITPGQNIRPLGEQIKKGEIALHKNSPLTPAAIGYLATLGVTETEVFAQPKTGLLLTGNELVKPGTILAHGQIYESNSAMLVAALEHYYQASPAILKVPDELNATQQALENLLTQNDVVLISGGISVGDYDFVKTALERLGVKEQFYKVKQKPGKPVFFGTLGQKLIFALPGNPASALTCFYIYVLPALRKLSGHPFQGLQKVRRKLAQSYQKKPGLAHFLKGIADDESAGILENQSSAMLNSFSQANALIYVPEEAGGVPENTLVDVYLF